MWQRNILSPGGKNQISIICPIPVSRNERKCKYIYVSKNNFLGKLTIIGSDNGLLPGRCQAIILVLNQCWNIVNWTLRNKRQWNFDRNSTIFTEENMFENVFCEMMSILSQPQCVNFNFHISPQPYGNGKLADDTMVDIGRSRTSQNWLETSEYRQPEKGKNKTKNTWKDIAVHISSPKAKHCERICSLHICLRPANERRQDKVLSGCQITLI